MKSVLAACRLVPVLVVASGTKDDDAIARGLAEVVDALQDGGDGGPPDEGSGGLSRWTAIPAAQAAFEHFQPLWRGYQSQLHLEHDIGLWFRTNYGRRS